MVGEFDLPTEIIDRKVTKMKMISPSNREVDVGKTLSETEYIGMCRREVLDSFMRNRAKDRGAQVINGLVMRLEQATTSSPTVVLTLFTLFDASSPDYKYRVANMLLEFVVSLHSTLCQTPHGQERWYLQLLWK